MLKFPPIKYTKNPQILFYKSKLKIDKETDFFNYIAFDRKGEILGQIMGKPLLIKPLSDPGFFPGFKKIHSFYINFLRSYKQNFCDTLLDFVQIESKKYNCGGRFHLIASDKYSKNGRAPHVSYRKYGMNSLDNILIKNIDNYLAGRIPFEDLETIDTPMYFIPKESIKKKKSVTNPFKEFFAKVINKYA